jgi:diguanylate cyclase (GGDEF)-like protein
MSPQFFRLYLLALCLSLFATTTVARQEVRSVEPNAVRIELERLRMDNPLQAAERCRILLRNLKSSPDDQLEMELLWQLLESLNENEYLSQEQAPGSVEALAAIKRGSSLSSASNNSWYWRRFELARIGRSHPKFSQIDKTMPLLWDLLAKSKDAGDIEVAVRSLLMLHSKASSVGDDVFARRYLMEAQSLADKNENLRASLAVSIKLDLINLELLDGHDLPSALISTQAIVKSMIEVGNFPKAANGLFVELWLLDALGKFDELILAYEMLFEITSAHGMPFRHHVAALNLSDIFLKKRKFQKSFELANSSIQVARSFGYKGSEGVALVNVGEALFGMGRRDEGLELMERGQQLSDFPPGYWDLANKYESLGNFKRAMANYKLAYERSANDRRDGDSARKELAKLETRFELERREKIASQAETDRQRQILIRNSAIGGGLLSLALALSVLARFRLARRSAKELSEANTRLETLSYTDSLTGLRNRRYFQNHVEQYTVETSRHHIDEQQLDSPENADMLFFLVDLDHFKAVNDNFGHHAGDLVLKQAAQRLQSATREGDELIRWGGEEFMLVSKQANREQGAAMAERLRQAIDASPFDLGNGKTLTRTCSIGFAAFPLVPNSVKQPSWEAVVDLADQALYVAKESGRNAWVGLLKTSEIQEFDGPAKLRNLAEQCLENLVHSTSVNVQAVWQSQDRHMRQSAAPSDKQNRSEACVLAGQLAHVAT